MWFSFQRYKKDFLWLIVGGAIWRWMMRTELNTSSALLSLLIISLLWLYIFFFISKKYWNKTFFGVLMVMVLWVTVEFIWIKACYPYWCFSYSNLVGPRFFDTFPISLFFIWPIIVVSISQFIWKQKNIRISAFIWWMLLVFLDIFLDPVAVYQWLRSYNISESASTWYWVPFSNYVWWLLTGSISSFIILKQSNRLLWDKILKNIWLFIVWMYVFSFFSIVFSI